MALISNTVITKAGTSAAIAGGDGGPKIKIVGFRIGENSLREGYQPLDTDTDVSGFVYQGDGSQITYKQVTDDSFVYTLTLDNNVGPFPIGCIGLLMDTGDVFTIGALTQRSQKVAANPPIDLGNRKTYQLYVEISNQANIVDFTILVENVADLPWVPTELDLPNPNSAPHNAYQVRNHTRLGVQALAMVTEGVWQYTPLRTLAGAGDGILSVETPTSKFDNVATPIWSIVHWDTTSGKYIKTDPGSTKPLGIRTSAWEITTLGLIEKPGAGWTPGAVYYAGVGSQAGQLVLTDTGFKVGHALSATRMWVDFPGGAIAVQDPYRIFFNTGITSWGVINVPTSWHEALKVGITANARVVLMGMRVTNRGNTPADFYAALKQGDAPNLEINFAPGHAVEPGETLEILFRMAVLQTNDIIFIRSSHANMLDWYATGLSLADSKLFRALKNLNNSSPVTIYQGPSGERATIESILISNTHLGMDGVATVQRTSQDGNVSKMAARQLVPVGSSIEIIRTERLLVNPARIEAYSGTLGNIDVWLSGRKH